MIDDQKPNEQDVSEKKYPHINQSPPDKTMKTLTTFTSVIIGATLGVACTQMFYNCHRLPQGFKRIESDGFTFAWRETTDCWTNTAGECFKFSKGGPEIVRIEKPQVEDRWGPTNKINIQPEPSFAAEIKELRGAIVSRDNEMFKLGASVAWALIQDDPSLLTNAPVLIESVFQWKIEHIRPP